MGEACLMHVQWCSPGQKWEARLYDSGRAGLGDKVGVPLWADSSQRRGGQRACQPRGTSCGGMRCQPWTSPCGDTTALK